MNAPIFESFRQTLNARLEPKARRFTRERLQACRAIREGHVLCKTLHVPFLELDLPPWDPAPMLAEAVAARAHFVAHRSDDSAGWKALCLHGIEPQKTLSFDRYGYLSEKDVPYVWTEASRRCPITTGWLKELVRQGYFQELYRVRYMWLEPGGYISYHRDRAEGQHSLGPLNIALNMPRGCHWLFRDWGTVPFTPGKAFCVDISNEHGVWNDSREDRIHIIVHGKYGRAYYNGIAHSAARLHRQTRLKRWLDKFRSENY